MSHQNHEPLVPLAWTNEGGRDNLCRFGERTARDQM